MDHVFGYGRRACPGRHFLLSSFWLHIASILATFEIHPAKDQTGNPIIPTPEYASGLVRYGTLFTAIITTRYIDARIVSQFRSNVGSFRALQT